MGSGPPLAPLAPPRSLSEDAADRIRERILSGGFRSGEHLVEARIAEQLAISRGPVREAFKLLRAEGLLTEEPRRGTFVVSLGDGDVREIYGLRAALEGRAARMLSRSHDPEAVAELRELAAGIDRAVASADGVAVSHADLAFHQAICRLSGNPRILEVFDRYVPTLRALLRQDELTLGSLRDVSEQHRDLLEAIEAGDEDAAARLFSDHAERAGDLIAAVVASTSEPSDEVAREGVVNR